MKNLKAILLFPLLACLLPACESQLSDEERFLQACDSSADCPDGWVCPELVDGSGYGKIGNVCTPICSEDADCKSALGRLDVLCFKDICALGCGAHSDCPDELPYCRGSHPSCASITGQPWCSTEDFTCD